MSNVSLGCQKNIQSGSLLSERAQGPNLLYCTSRWMFKSRYYHFMTSVMDEGTILGVSWS